MEKFPICAGKIQGVTGIILAGGASSRMGSNKALLPFRGGRFIESIHRLLGTLFDEVLVVTNHPEQYRFLPCRKVPDVFPGMGALAGLHGGLKESANPWIFAVACDMPNLSGDLIRWLAGRGEGSDLILPHTVWGAEPLHAFYGKACLDAMESALASGEKQIASFFGSVRLTRVPAEMVALLDPGFHSFRNVNTPDEYYHLRGEDRREGQPVRLQEGRA